MLFWDSGTRLEQHFHATETFSTDSADVSVWEVVGLFLVNFRSRFEICVVIQTNVAKTLPDTPSNLPLCGGSEGIHTSNLGRHVRGGLVERLKPGLRHALSISLGVQNSFRGQNGMPFKRNQELVVESVFLQVVPIRDDAVHDKGTQYFYPAQGWRLRSQPGWRVWPRKSPASVRSEVTTPRRGQRTFEQKHLQALHVMPFL